MIHIVKDILIYLPNYISKDVENVKKSINIRLFLSFSKFECHTNYINVLHCERQYWGERIVHENVLENLLHIVLM